MCKKLKVLLIDNEDDQFDEMSGIIDSALMTMQIPYELIFNYNENMELIRLFRNILNTGNMSKLYLESFQKMLDKIPSSEEVICIIDCNLGYSGTDHLGIKFIFDHLRVGKNIHLNNIVLVSIFPRKDLGQEINGLHFVHKSKSTGKRNNRYPLELKDAIVATRNVVDFHLPLPILESLSLSTSSDEEVTPI